MNHASCGADSQLIFQDGHELLIVNHGGATGEGFCVHHKNVKYMIITWNCPVITFKWTEIKSLVKFPCYVTQQLVMINECEISHVISTTIDTLSQNPFTSYSSSLVISSTHCNAVCEFLPLKLNLTSLFDFVTYLS